MVNIRRLITLLLTYLFWIGGVYAKDFYVSSITDLNIALREAENNRDNDVIYIRSGIYDVNESIYYLPDDNEHFSLTITSEDPHAFVFLQRKLDIPLIKANFSNNNKRVSFILKNIYIGDSLSSEGKDRPLIDIKGKNVEVQILKCQLYGSFSDIRHSNIRLDLYNSFFIGKENIFFRNASSKEGSAITITGKDNKIALERNDFYSNKSMKGTIYLNTFNSDILLNNNRFYNGIVYYDFKNARSGILLEGKGNNIYILNNYFFGDISNGNGASIYIGEESSYALIFQNQFIYNYSKYGNGSAVYINVKDNSHIDLLNNTFAYNSSKVGGAVDIHLNKSSVFVGNNIFNKNHTYSDNDLEEKGGALHLSVINSDAYIMNNVLYSNYSYGTGGGLYLEAANDSNVKLFNNIFWRNYEQNEENSNGLDIFIENDNSPVYVYNNLYSFLTATVKGNLYTQDNLVDQDPKFVGAEWWNFHLDNDSPCIDAGIIPEGINIPLEFYKDIDEEPRIIGNSIDIGVDEYATEEINPKEKGRLIIKRENTISTAGLTNSKVKLICLRYFTIRSVRKYKWDIDGDGQIDLETVVPFAEVDSFSFSPNKVSCYVEYLDGSIEKVN